VGQPDEPVRRVVGIRGGDSVFEILGGEAAHRGVGIAGQWAAVESDGGDFAAWGVGVRDDVASRVGGRDWGAIGGQAGKYDYWRGVFRSQ
jgi:hypothetical protein